VIIDDAIDEARYAPVPFRYLIGADDTNRTSHGQFFLISSQKFTVIMSVSGSPAGRADLVELETLSLNEIRAAPPQTMLESTIVRGGFPELHANPGHRHCSLLLLLINLTGT
jgi:predicted AAA+ superfamily ATPase